MVVNGTIWMVAVFWSCSAMGLHSQELVFDLDAGKKKYEVPSTLYGIFFEDINFAADGGLYAELVKNRSFEFPQAFMGWKVFGSVTLCEDGPFPNNPHYVRLKPVGHRWKHTGIQNEGFFGMGFQKQASYRFSVWARLPEGGEPQIITVELGSLDPEQRVQAFAATDLQVVSKEWKKYEVILQAGKSTAEGFLRIFLSSSGIVDLEHVSLFPVDTWKRHSNGLRKDLAQVLADLKPGVFRFPGGCIVEGTELGTHYDWKKTVGPVENRPLNENRWHFTFKHRLYPDYYQSYGLGFYEYFLFAEEIGAEPLPILNCGLICQYMSASIEEHVPTDSLECFIQDVLDLIEFANGDRTSEWGKVRAEMGHPDPFHLKYVGIGNEQWGPEYIERLEPFVTALRRRYPEIRIVGSGGPQPEGAEFDFLWPEMKRLKVDLVDEHFYRDEHWFLSQAMRYDGYDRTGPKVFAGEYACHVSNSGRNQFLGALSEAAFLTGVERNADVVRMATYAPLLAHVKGWQWRPDLVWFDNLSVCRTSSYWVQYLFSRYRGTDVLDLTMDRKPIAGLEGQAGMYASAVWDEVRKAFIVKLVNTSSQMQSVRIRFMDREREDAWQSVRTVLLTALRAESENGIGNGALLFPREHTGMVVSGDDGIVLSSPPTSVVVCIIPSSSFCIP